MSALTAEQREALALVLAHFGRDERVQCLRQLLDSEVERLPVPEVSDSAFGEFEAAGGAR